MLQILRAHPAQTHLALMLALTFSTGVIDAVGFLGLDRVFSANMTGNVVILGMAVTGADGLPIVGPLLALTGFVVGAALAGRLLRDLAAGWSSRTTLVFSIVAAILILGALILLFTQPGPAPASSGVAPETPSGLLLALTACFGIAMGAQAGTARHIGVKDVPTVVVTSTLMGLAADSIFGARVEKHPWRRRLAAIVLIAVGAAVGALTLTVHIGLGVALSAMIIGTVTVIGHLTRPEKAQ